MGDRLRSLYICYLSLEDPLVHTQVVAYLEGLAQQGHTIHLLTFDPKLSAERRATLEQGLSERGIAWHSLRYHKRPSLPATVYDALAAAVCGAALVRRHRLDAVHARNHVPAASALIIRRLTGSRLIFDLRGLMAEEYVDAGHWRRGGLPYRITNWIQRAALARAVGIVVLTEAVRRHLFPDGRPNVCVIPCCADLALHGDVVRGRDTLPDALGLGTRPVMVYVGKFTGWYMDRETAEFFAAARRARPDLCFLVLTQADPAPLRRELRRLDVAESDYVIVRAEPEAVGRWLAAADFGISLVRPGLSKISSSPTKIGEYLAAGLPVVSTAGIGDVDGLLNDNGVGVLVRQFTTEAYEAAARDVKALAEDPDCARRCREVAQRHLSLAGVGIPRYDMLYRSVAAERMSSATVGAQAE